MKNCPYLYVMLSRTDTGVGRMIRFFTRYNYNHVSLTLDPSLTQWVSFARYRVDVPLAGGFVEEPAERFLSRGISIPVRIYRIPLTEEQYQRLHQLFSLAGRRDSGLIYNLFSAFFTAFGRPYPIPGAYTCLDFACTVLDKPSPSIRKLDEALEPQLFFEGTLETLVSDTQRRDDLYFTPRGLLPGLWDTALHIRCLFSRAIWADMADPVLEILGRSQETA